MIKDLQIVPLRKIPDERGAIIHMLKSTDPHFTKFGETYFSICYPGAIKGWHLHTKMTQNYAVVFGMIKLVIYDPRPESPTYKQIQEIFTGELNYCLVQIPPGVVNGYKTIGTQPALIANVADTPYDPKDPSEMKRIDPFDPSIPYDWAIKHR